MSHAQITPAAQADLLDIWLFIGADNLDAADVFMERLHEVFQTLSENSMLGRARPDIEPGIRRFSVNKYSVFYKPLEYGIEIVRVLHSARDVNQAFRGD